MGENVKRNTSRHGRLKTGRSTLLKWLAAPTEMFKINGIGWESPRW